MNKLDVHPIAPSYAIAHTDPGPVHRLIILAPDPEADVSNAAPSVWELANSLGSSVLFVGLCRDEAQEPSLRRQMIALSAMVGTGNVSVDSRIEFGKNWLEIIKNNWQMGDAIVCFAGQPSGAGRKPLSELFASNIQAPVYVLAGLHPDDHPRSNRLTTGLVWAGAIGILAGFFWLQVKLTQLPNDWAHTVLLYLSIFVEVGLIWGWNSLFS